MRLRQYYIYVLSSSHQRVLYVGITNNLERRMFEHKQGAIEDFTKQYNVKYLLYYEIWDSVDRAIAREKQLKQWHREWKLNLIKASNPALKDLSAGLTEL